MAVKFVLGRSGSGKTQYCLDQIRSELRQAPVGPPLILLTPEQATFQMEYKLLRDSELNGMLRAQAMSFRRLAFRVMQETGGTAYVPITDTGKHMLLYKLVHRMHDELTLFQNSEGQAGFIERVAEMLTEWKRYGVNAEQVMQLSEDIAPQQSKQLQQKLHDLALLYRQMERELENKYVDSEDYLHFMEQNVANASSLAGCKVWVDGFFGFTPTEYAALGSLIAMSAEVTIALTLPRAYEKDEQINELELFHQTAETYQTIIQLAEQHNCEVIAPYIAQYNECSRFHLNAELSFLENNYGLRRRYSGDAEKQGDQQDRDTSAITVTAAANRRAEVEALARHMLQQVHKHQYRWQDFAVLIRNMDGYADYLEYIMRDYDIPIFMDQKQKTLYHPLVEFISSSLETIIHGWQYDALFRCVKTELLFPFDDSIPREWFDILENYVLGSGINGWKWKDAKYWNPQATVSLDEDDENAYMISEKAQKELEIALAARMAIVPTLEKLATQLEDAKNVKEMCRALYEMLVDIRAADRLERWSWAAEEAGELVKARTHRQLWDSVMKLLEELVELAGEEQITPTLFAGMVDAGLASLKLASIPPSLDQVVIGSMERTRLANVKICYVLGASDGVIPMKVQEDGILSEADRDVLVSHGLAMAPSARRRLLDERFLIYNTLTTPSDQLWISYPLADEEGKTILPSEIIRSLLWQFPHIEHKVVSNEPALTMSLAEQRDYIAHPKRALTYLIAKFRQWKQGEQLNPMWWDLYNWFALRPAYEKKLTTLLRSLQFDNIELPLQLVTAKGLYGEKMMMSVSRVERFVSCPFQHFSIYGLRLKERKQYRLAAPDMGQLFHAALGKLANELGERWGRTSASEVKQQVGTIVDQLVPRLQSQILLSSERFKYIATKLKEIVMQTAAMLGEHAGRGQFNPIGTEIDFGPNGTLPSLKIGLDNGSIIEIIGRIDRLDGAETEQGLLLRVLDYKSSQTGLRLDDVVHGLSLQMLAYMDVLLTHGEAWLKQKITPAGVLYFHVHNPFIAVKNEISQYEADELMLKKYKMKGLLTADTTIVRMMDNELESGYSQIIPVAVKKDDTFYNNASVISLEEWDVLRQYVRNKMKQIGEKIQDGVVTIEPYQLGDRTPCQYCDYKPVCQFDASFEGNEYHKLNRHDQDELWNVLRG